MPYPVGRPGSRCQVLDLMVKYSSRVADFWLGPNPIASSTCSGERDQPKQAITLPRKAITISGLRRHRRVAFEIAEGRNIEGMSRAPR